MKVRILKTNKVIKVYPTDTRAIGGGCRTLRLYKDYDGREYWSHEFEFVPDDMPLSEPEDEVTRDGWVARDKSGYLVLHYKEPHRTLGNTKWYSAQSQKSLPRSSFPSVTWESGPLPVTITIKPKKK